MNEIYADFMKLDEWSDIPGQSVPIAPIADMPGLAALDGQTVTLISFDLRAEGRIIQRDGWWFAVLTSEVMDNPVSIAT